MRVVRSIPGRNALVSWRVASGKWFGHDPARWAGLRDRYFRELDMNRTAVEQLLEHARRGTVTLVYDAKDPGIIDKVDASAS
jgi:uncharacterized protein YeaO (DUF488 family)